MLCENSRKVYTSGEDLVLILVLMEDALRAQVADLFNKALTCLNPCSNGRCSARGAFFLMHNVDERS